MTFTGPPISSIARERHTGASNGNEADPTGSTGCFCPGDEAAAGGAKVKFVGCAACFGPGVTGESNVNEVDLASGTG